MESRLNFSQDFSRNFAMNSQISVHWLTKPNWKLSYTLWISTKIHGISVRTHHHMLSCSLSNQLIKFVIDLSKLTWLRDWQAHPTAGYSILQHNLQYLSSNAGQYQWHYREYLLLTETKQSCHQGVLQDCIAENALCTNALIRTRARALMISHSYRIIKWTFRPFKSYVFCDTMLYNVMQCCLILTVSQSVLYECYFA